MVPRLLDFLTESVPDFLLHGVYLHHKFKRTVSHDVPVFTILRSIALLHIRAGKLITTCILVGLALVLFMINTVRLQHTNTIVVSALL